MKYILIAIFAMALNSANGQINVSQDWLTLTDSISATASRFERETDTIKVVLLVSDTGQKYMNYGLMKVVYDSVINRQRIVEEKTPYFNNQLFWQFGYSVREFQEDSRYNNANGFWMHTHFLDDKKQPLKPTIIVWKSIEAKP